MKRLPSMRRRLVLRGVLAGGVAGLAGAGAMALMRTAHAQNGPAPREIAVTARRFQFTPNEIPLKAGERVVIAISSIDFVHGFNVPDLKLRRDLMPGQVTRVELQPDAPGVIDFLCDNFCGDGHETMHGRFVVSA
jgi:cytochrome c oxidase subunit 2